MRVGEREGERERGGGVRTTLRVACFMEKLVRTSSNLGGREKHVQHRHLPKFADFNSIIFAVFSMRRAHKGMYTSV